MAAEVISFTQARLERMAQTGSCERLPLALQCHIGAVELIIGSPADESAVELHMSPEQALELADDLRRTALAARSSTP